MFSRSHKVFPFTKSFLWSFSILKYYFYVNLKIETHPLLKQARSLGPFLEIIKDVIKNWSLDYKENYVDILNNTENVNPNIK